MKTQENTYRCYDERIDYNLEDLGDDAWLTGCPFCGSSSCGKNMPAELKAEIDKELDERK